MANDTGNSGVAEGHQQSIGAHVNAGGAGQRQGSTQDSPPARARVPDGKRLSGMNGRGVAHVAGAVGMLGTPRPAIAFAESSPDAVPEQDSVELPLRGKRGGQSSRQHASGQ